MPYSKLCSLVDPRFDGTTRASIRPAPRSSLRATVRLIACAPTLLIAFLLIAPMLAHASVVHIPGPDLPMQRPAWLERAMDSKTCPIVSLRPAAPKAGEGDALMATIWRADDDDASDLGTWPALFLSLGGRPLALRRIDGNFDIETRTLGSRGEVELSWSAPAEQARVALLLKPPRRFVEDGHGGWTERPKTPAGQTRGDGDEGSTRLLWSGIMALATVEGRWSGKVEVESICGP